MIQREKEERLSWEEEEKGRWEAEIEERRRRDDLKKRELQLMDQRRKER